jgi:hypothetical protein
MRVAVCEGEWEGEGEETYGEQMQWFQALARDDGHELHFAQKGNFGRCEAWR